MTDATTLLELVGVQLAASGLATALAGLAFRNVAEGGAASRARLAAALYWLSAASPLFARLPAALQITRGGVAAPAIWAPRLPDLPLAQPLAVAILAGLGFGSALRLTAVVRDALRSERRARAALRSATLRQGLRVAGDASIGGPTLIGLIRPVLLAPPEELARLTPSVLRHEAAHLRRNHLPGLLLQRLAGALFWWNPGLARLGRHLAEAREILCDADAARGDGRGFAQDLLVVARRRQAGPDGALELGLGEVALARRIDRLLARPRLVSLVLIGVWLLLLAGLAATPRLAGAGRTTIDIASS